MKKALSNPEAVQRKKISIWLVILIPTVLGMLLPNAELAREYQRFLYRMRGEKSHTLPLTLIQLKEPIERHLAAQKLERVQPTKCIDLVEAPVLEIPRCQQIVIRRDADSRETLEQLKEISFSPSVNPSPSSVYYFSHFVRSNFIDLSEWTERIKENPSLGEWVVFAEPELVDSLRGQRSFGEMSGIQTILNYVLNIGEKLPLRIMGKNSLVIHSMLGCLMVWILLSYYPVFIAAGTLSIIVLAYGILGAVLFDDRALLIPFPEVSSAVLASYLLGVTALLGKRQEEEWSLEDATRNLQSLDEMRTNFLSLVTHDLKTPIARIRSLLEQFLRGDFGVLIGAQSENLQRVMSASGDLQRSISTMILLSRIESKDLDLRREPTDLSLVLNEVTRGARQMALERDIKILEEFEALFLVDLDQALIREVATNLLDNAIKYTPSGGKIVLRCGETENLPELSPPQPGIWFEIRDEGPGVPVLERSLIFDKFVKGSNEKFLADPSLKGSGLGLYLSSYFVKKHGGVIALFSREKGEKLKSTDPSCAYFQNTEIQHGTIVRVSLPVDDQV